MKNEVDMSNLFDNFFPGGRIQMDFAERGTESFLVTYQVIWGRGLKHESTFLKVGYA